jgi:hypothetical protein
MPKKTRKVESQNRLKLLIKIDVKIIDKNVINLLTHHH